MSKRYVAPALSSAILLAVAALATAGSDGSPTRAPATAPATGSIMALAAAFPGGNRIAGVADASPAITAGASERFIRHDIEVTAVDPAASQQPNKTSMVPNRHLALTPTKPADRKARLFVFIGGTNSTETITQEILLAGVRRGYHAIAVAYPNYDAVVPLCLGSTDDLCTYKVRQEILTGQDLTPLVTIAPKDAFETRLRTALAYLRKTYPGEGWKQYLHGGEIDWSRISAVGHSQGAGHAALLAKLHSMFRSVMISGVADLGSRGQPAPWLALPNATPVERQYGFTHLGDYVVPVAVANASWDAIGLQAFGPLTQTDNQPQGYSGSHKLTTALVPAKGTNPHVAMLHDAQMPRAADGTPAFRPVWDFIAFP